MAEPRTIVVPISNTSDTVAYTLAPGLAQYVQSVYVEVDNTAGSDARATLTVSEQAGVVIAKKRQGEAIPAGDTGSATWALRLTDEDAATPSSGGDVVLLWEYTVPVGGQAVVDTSVDGAMAGLLSQAYFVLEAFGLTRSDNVSAPHGGKIQFNGDTTNSHYDTARSIVQGTPAATVVANQFSTGSFGWTMPAANAAAGRSGSFSFVVPNYASTLLHKSGTLQNYCAGGAGNAGTDTQLTQAGFNWHPAAVTGIDQITFTNSLGNFVEGSYFAVYGRA